MDKIVLKDIDVQFDVEAMAASARIRKESSVYTKLAAAALAAQPIVKPKAVIKTGVVDSVQNGITSINGVNFNSKVISEKLCAGAKVFLYVVTTGATLGSSDNAIEDFIIYVLESAALAQGCQTVKKYLQDKYGYGEMEFFEPGSLPADLPIEYNKIIFEMIGEVTQDIGVTLKASHFMNPNNTLSGIFYGADK